MAIYGLSSPFGEINLAVSNKALLEHFRAQEAQRAAAVTARQARVDHAVVTVTALGLLIGSVVLMWVALSLGDRAGWFCAFMTFGVSLYTCRCCDEWLDRHA